MDPNGSKYKPNIMCQMGVCDNLKQPDNQQIKELGLRFFNFPWKNPEM